MSEAEPLEPPTADPAPRGPGVLQWGPWIKRLLIVCLAAELLWVVLDQVLFWHAWIDVDSVASAFEMGEERNASTWFATLQATFAAFTVFGIYLATRGPDVSRRTLRGWLVAGGFFAYIGMDEMAMLHENIGAALRDTIGRPRDVRFPPLRWWLEIETHDWQLLVLPLLGAVGLFVCFFLWKELDRFGLRKFLVLGMCCYVLALIMDFLQGRENFFWDLGGRLLVEESEVEHHWAVVEETLEMLGTTLFWQAFLRHLARLTDGRTLHFTRDGT